MRGSSPFLSTLSPSPRERRAALVVVLISIAVFLAAAPFAKSPLVQRAVLVLAAGYLFSALIAVAHALSFPGLFAAAGLLGAGGQTTAWLYFLWHGGFPLFVIGYALLKGETRDADTRSTDTRIEILTRAYLVKENLATELIPAVTAAIGVAPATGTGTGTGTS